jgi:metal-responsive CopG/Arc/MetJ family transcriptional regulator
LPPNRESLQNRYRHRLKVTVTLSQKELAHFDALVTRKGAFSRSELLALLIAQAWEALAHKGPTIELG